MHIAATQCSMLQVTLVHLYQAGMFADLDQISTGSHPTPLASGNRGGGRGKGSAPVAGAKVSAAEAPLREEVQHKLQHLPPALFNTCQQVCLRACLCLCITECLDLSVCAVVIVNPSEDCCQPISRQLCHGERPHVLASAGGEGGAAKHRRGFRGAGAASQVAKLTEDEKATMRSNSAPHWQGCRCIWRQHSRQASMGPT